MILSASRRTDIPAFFGEWLLNRLRAGSVPVRNPRNPAQESRIALSPETVDCIVFWTKDPAPLLPKLDELDALGYRYVFLFTLNNYGAMIEPGVPPPADRIANTDPRGRKRNVSCSVVLQSIQTRSAEPERVQQQIRTEPRHLC